MTLCAACRGRPHCRPCSSPSCNPRTTDGCWWGACRRGRPPPGRWQLPGGSAEPPADHERLDEAALRRHAARELAEETGVDTAPHELRLWAVTRGRRGSTGVYFRAPARPASVLAERFMAAVAAETALGREPEFAETALVRSPADLGTLPGSHADYLEIVLRRYAHRPDDSPERA
ncbi:NUDIX hydrolase [Streptomyces antimycoticus]|uniref:NUDIX hydrolase n=1 Tax=Streptomyces antimycoticus TaxID=68175 RepID=UPI0037FBA043